MGLRIAYSSIFLAVETFPVNVCCFVCFCSTLVLFQPLLMFCLQVPGFGLLDRISIALLLIPTTTTTTTVIVIFNLPAILTHCLGRTSSKNLCGRTQREQRRLCVWVRSAHAGFARIGLWEISLWSLLWDTGRTTQGGGQLRNQWGFWWWIYPLPPSFLDSYSPTFSKALRGQECPSSAYWGIVFSNGQQSVLLGVVPKSQLWTLFELW